MASNTVTAKTFTPLTIPAPIKTLFSDIRFAHVVAEYISAATGMPVTIEDVVTQDMLDKVTVMRVLSADPRKFTSLQGIGHLRNLQELMIERQPVTCLPEDFGTLKKLTLGYFINCSIKSIPCWIGNLTSLTVLDLSSQIPLGVMRGAVPESIGNLTQLERFDISNNSNLCGKLPDSLARLTSLKSLSIQSNGFEDLSVLNALHSVNFFNFINQALGIFDLGRVRQNSSLPIRLPEIFVQAQTPGDKLYVPSGVEILGSPGAYLDQNRLYVHLPTDNTGTFEVMLAIHGRLTNVSYRWTVTA
jgi:Leucine-rich repeat (LRR) protein